MPNDPFADAMNTSGYAGLIGPNPYLEYTGQIPMAGYRGAPTDAAGNPIASFRPGPTAARRLERRQSCAGRAGRGNDVEFDAAAWRHSLSTRHHARRDALRADFARARRHGDQLAGARRGDDAATNAGRARARRAD